MTLSAAFIVIALLLLLLPASSAAGAVKRKTAKAKKVAASSSGATFDLTSMFPYQMLAPKAGKTMTWMSVDAANITETNEPVNLTTYCESPYFTACVWPPFAGPSGAKGKARSFVIVTCKPDTPEGTTGYVKVTGRRGAEEHRVWLKADVLASSPKLEMSQGDTGSGKGYTDPVLQTFTGKPVTWELGATNRGCIQDTYTLGYQAGFPCHVRFLNRGGAEISQLAVPGLTHNYLYPNMINFRVEVTPLTALPKNRPQDITVTLGPGSLTGETAQFKVQVTNPGMLFCLNDLDGLKPRAHQVMAGESTSYVLEATNMGVSQAEITLGVSGGGGWQVSIDRPVIQSLAPGSTGKAILNVVSPAGAAAGDRAELNLTADSNLGAHDEATVAAEVTDVRNVYYWSIDSMNPEYMYLDRAGTGPGSPGDWLMPNLHRFISQCVNYKDARVFLPSATDMNHTNALAGSYTGTTGVYMVAGTYKSITAHDEILTSINSMDLMKYGPSGDPIQRIFEVADSETGGKSLNGFWSNKNWLTDMESERSVSVAGHSQEFPLFFPVPYKYVAGDPKSDENPSDPMTGPFAAGIYSDTFLEIIAPALLGQFPLITALGMFLVPLNQQVGMTPGSHCEDRYLTDSFFRSILDEDPDISYINIGDLDNTGHFTGASWDTSEWETKGTPTAADDVSKYNSWARRDDCLDICREADLLFADFLDLLKSRGVYDNSVIVFLSDHGMENSKDPAKGYQVIDLRKVLRDQGLLFKEDYVEEGGTEINELWCSDPARCARIEQALEDFTVNDPELGTVHPLTVIDRQEMLNGVDFGTHGRVRPHELYSDYWITHPNEPDGQQWPDLFVFPLYNYNVVAHGQILAGGMNPVGMTFGNMPDSMLISFQGTHGGLQTTHIPLLFKAPAGYAGYAPGTEVASEVTVADITPTIYRILGWPDPPCVDGSPLPSP